MTSYVCDILYHYIVVYAVLECELGELGADIIKMSAGRGHPLNWRIMFIGLPKPPETWSEQDKTLYLNSIPSNHRSFRWLSSDSNSFHVICQDNVIRGFRPSKRDDKLGTVTYQGKRIRGRIETSGNFDFFFAEDIVGNPDMPSNSRVRLLQHMLAVIDDPSIDDSYGR